MEFERAIFRVYERCLDGLRDENENNEYDSKGCRFLELLMLIISTFLMASLILLHTTFVGSPGCLPYLLVVDNYTGIATQLNASTLLNYDQILNINIEDKYIPQRQLAAAGKNLRSTNHMTLDLPGFSSMLHLVDMNNNISANINANMTASAPPPSSYDYQFSFEVGELFLSDKIRSKHDFEIVNVTLAGAECFGSHTTQSLVAMGGIDSVVLNALMFTFRRPGNVVTATGDFYRWGWRDITLYSNAAEWVNFKVGIVIMSLSSFFFLSTVTALLVRVLISSGVVLLFPLFHLVQYFGMQPINLRIISLSYPWIGVPMEIMRARNQSTAPFLMAHMTRVVVFYVLYQAVQAAFGSWFFRPTSSPGQPELWLFALMMVVEYFSMIYVRAKQSIQLFPKAFCSFYLLFHIYYYSFPSGFHMLALATVFALTVLLMAFCIRTFEIKAFYTGVVGLDTPRSLYNSLPWPSIRADLAPDVTLFMPVTSQAVSIYQTNVPAIASVTNATASAAAGAQPPRGIASTAVTTAGVTDSARSPIHPSALDLEAGVPRGAAVSGANSRQQQQQQGDSNGSIQMTSLQLLPTYHDPESTALGSSGAGETYRKVPLNSGTTINSSSSSKIQYARLDGSSHHGRTEDEEDEEDR